MKCCSVILVLWMGLALQVWAHKSSDAYLEVVLTNGVASVRLDVALRDLQEVFALDADEDTTITWGEVRTRARELSAYVGSRLHFEQAGEAIEWQPWSMAVTHHTDGGYLAFESQVQIPKGTTHLDVRYGLLFDVDAQHRGLASFRQSPGSGGSVPFVFGPTQRTFTWNLAVPTRVTFGQFIVEGVHHIWTGYDHMMFLLALLLPAVLWRGSEGRWIGVGCLGVALREVVKVVTAFTLAHSLTLFAAAMGWISLPSRWVESAIAASVVVAALGNLIPRRPSAKGREGLSLRGILRRWGSNPAVMAFGFGLIHGFGFASVLGELALDRASFGWGVLGFNLGVEMGQLAVVLLFIPVAYGLRETWFYRRIALQGGSAAIVAVAAAWLLERSCGLAFMPF